MGDRFTVLTGEDSLTGGQQFQLSVFPSFIFPQEIHDFRENIYTLFKSIKIYLAGMC